MLRKVLSVLFLVSSFSLVQAQDGFEESADSTVPPAFKPTIGVGTGLMSFYGDFYERSFQNPLTSRIAYEFYVSQKITRFAEVSFFGLYGQLGANERMSTRSLNMQSQIRAGGISLSYNFDNFLKPDRVISPYLSVGIETFEFLTKTDLYDQNGNKYFYWSDGSIRNLDENSPIASTANFLVRDYTYESDVRELDIDGFGRYPERSLAIPVGVGAILHISERVNLKVGTSMHFTFTDYIDGITDQSLGNRAGDKQKDKFLMTSFSLSYNLDWRSKNDTLPPGHFDGVDFLALGEYDDDGDGVNDINDSCAGTPLGVVVNEFGCPNDDDNDGVPNHLDKEPNTPAGAYVNAEGVELTDSVLLYQYQVFMDTSGMFAETVYEKHGSQVPGDQGRRRRYYQIMLGTYTTGITPDLLTKYLSIGDIRTTNLDDSTTAYTAGMYSNYYAAERRKSQFEREDSLLKDLKIVYFQDGQFIEATGPDPVASGDYNNSEGGNNSYSLDSNVTWYKTPDYNSKEVVFRVQLGAYRNKLTRNVFPGVTDLIEMRSDDGLYKYMAGSYNNFEAAAARKADLVTQGFRNAFVTAYQGGKRVSLKSQGVEASGRNANKKEDLSEPGPAVSSVDKSLIVFKVQVGIFKNEPPSNVKVKFDKISGGVKKEITTTGLSRFVVGSFNSYNDAVKKKDSLVNSGIDDAFIIAFFNGQYITVQEALELLK